MPVDCQPPSAPDTPVTILLASYRGARFIGAQLASIAAQTHQDWRLIVSDDGSDDGTRDIVTEFAASRPKGQVQVVDGPGRGATQNFLHLLSITPDGPIAFSDQDDVWFPDKLARALAALSRHNGPAHYAARTVITDDDMNPLTESRHFHRPLGFRNALVQAIMAGNTSVFNGPASALLRCCVGAAQHHDVEAHDWWAYQVMSGVGAVLIHDPQPALFYRQHSQSVMGRNDTVAALSQRVAMLLAGDYGRWLGANHAALHAVRSELLPENRLILDQFGALLRRPAPAAAVEMARLGLYRQTQAGTAVLFAAALLGRLRQCGPNSPIR
jgi:glycosyltransferase involved in cell wall biosynthesis